MFFIRGRVLGMDYYAVGIELLKGIGFFFLHPLFYILLLFGLWIGYRRANRERSDFHTRVYDVVDDVLKPIFPGLIAGFILSIVIVATGISFPIGMIALFAFVQLFLLLTGQARWLSPAYSGGLTLLIALILPPIEVGTVFIDRWISEIHAMDLSGLAIFISVIVIMEGLLIIKNGFKHTSPKLIKSKRGKVIGAHESQKLWVLPIFMLIPGGPIIPTHFWPLVGSEATTFGLMVVPFAIGFQQVIRSTLPVHAIINNGKRVLVIGITMLCLSIASIYISMFVLVVAIVAIIGREAVAFTLKIREDRQTNIYTQKENGLVVLGIIPRSPAQKLNVQVGEVVTKVNGIKVMTPQQFYEALQTNSAFCKLEIIDRQGEIRFAQTALYDGEHHQIGLLFVEQEPKYVEKII